MVGREAELELRNVIANPLGPQHAQEAEDALAAVRGRLRDPVEMSMAVGAETRGILKKGLVRVRWRSHAG
eukprot:49792-Pyramimonas_sp.AAC.1